MSEMYDQIVEKLISHLGIDPDLIQPEKTLADLDLDSLSLAELALVLEEELGITIDGIDKTSTLAHFADRLAESVPEAPPQSSAVVPHD